LKPENFCFGRGLSKDQLFLIDFGLSKKYKSQKRGHITTYVATRVGTKRYMSANAWEDKTQSRRDDLLSLVYILAYFWEGTLPWCSENINQKFKKDDNIKMAAFERKTNIELRKQAVQNKLIFRTQPRLQNLLSEIEKLKFEETPNYQSYQGRILRIDRRKF